MAALRRYILHGQPPMNQAGCADNVALLDGADSRIPDWLCYPSGRASERKIAGTGYIIMCALVTGTEILSYLLYIWTPYYRVRSNET